MAAVGGMLGASDGISADHLNIDEYMQLTRLIGVAPAVSVQMVFADGEEIERARQLVEYCNGDPVSSEMGRLRARRGHPAPFGVRTWFLGNEAGVAPRFVEVDPSKQREPGRWRALPFTTAADYTRMLKRMLPPLLEVDPSLRIIATTGSPNISWWKKWFPKSRDGSNHTSGLVNVLLRNWATPVAEAVGDQIWAFSYHYYLHGPPGKSPWDPVRLREAGRAPIGLLEALQTYRGVLDDPPKVSIGVGAGLHMGLNERQHRRSQTPRRHPLRISLDEWGFGPPWSTSQFGAAHAMYAATTLTTIANHAHSLQLASTNYFEPINEGVIDVQAWNATLTPMGQVMRLYARHQGQRLLRPAPPSTSTHASTAPVPAAEEVNAEVQLLITTDDDQSRMLITAANTVAAAPRKLLVSLPGWHPAWGAAEAVALRAQGVDPQVTRLTGGPGSFAAPRALPLAGVHGGTLPLELPPYSIVQISVGVRPS